MHLYVSPVAPERRCINDDCVARRSRTFRVRSTPRALPTAPPRSELGFNLPRSAALDADATSAQEHF